MLLFIALGTFIDIIHTEVIKSQTECAYNDDSHLMTQMGNASSIEDEDPIINQDRMANQTNEKKTKESKSRYT